MSDTDPEKRDTIVLGSSAGGIEALLRLLPAFGAQTEASVLIVQHLPANGQSILDMVLARATPCPVGFAGDGEVILPRRIYLAPPDRHLLVDGDRVRLLHGARENRARPAIDALFRSAAANRRGRVVGAILSGLLDDGAAGLAAVKRCGGLAFVQNPSDAVESEMPNRASHALGRSLDGALSADELGARLASLVGTPAAAGEVPEDVWLEYRMQLGEVDAIEVLARTGAAALSCPECGGPLWHVLDGRLNRYRCHVGHAYSAENLLSAQSRQIERALWVAIKGLEERSQMLGSFAASDLGSLRVGRGHYEQEASRLRQHARTLRELLVASFPSKERA